MGSVGSVRRLGVGHWLQMRGCPTVISVRAYCGWGECGTLWRGMELFCQVQEYSFAIAEGGGYQVAGASVTEFQAALELGS